MPISLPEDLDPSLVPLAWVLGAWAGVGVQGYPTQENDLQVGNELTFTAGAGFIEYSGRVWSLDDKGQRVQLLSTESGYWRVLGEVAVAADAVTVSGTQPEADGAEAYADVTGVGSPTAHEVEALITHPTGISEIYLGTVEGPRIMLATDVVARTASAIDYTAGRRLFGLVEGDLLWAYDMAAQGHELASYVSARLRRV